MKKESQVPKIIHLMWFSGDEYQDLFRYLA